MAPMGVERLVPGSNERRIQRVLLALALVSLGAACTGGSTAGGGSVSSGITYNGPTTWTITGPEGGPFSNTSMVVSLENLGNQSVAWSATSVPSFVQLDQISGVIQPNAQVQIHADLIVAVAHALTSGIYAESLTFHDDTTPQADIEIDCTLIVQIPSSSSQLIPSTPFASQGSPSGPFVPDSTVYSLMNTGHTVLSWQASASDAWISVAPSSGQLSPGDSVDVSVSIDDPATNFLTIGMHSSVVEWRDAANNAVLHSRDVNLDALPNSTSGGWTLFTPSADTRAVYVSSSSGSDANNGLSNTTPKRTIAAGKALLRDGFPDWLLLRRGDAWGESLGDWGLSGRSFTERMLVSSYGPGTERPLLRTGISNGFDALDGRENNNLAIVGLRFWANLYTGSQGEPRALLLFGAVHNFLLEDCYLQAYETNLVVQGASESPAATGRHINIAIRRNVIVDAYNTLNSNSQGIFASGTDGLLLEENVWDHNGWRDDIPGSEPTWYRRNIYIQNLCTGVVVRGNIVASTDGLQQRSGGICEDNLFLHDAIGIAFGLGGYPEIEVDGVAGTIRNNVVLDGGDLQPGSERGWGMWLGNISQSTIDSNVIAHNVSGHAPSPVTFEVAVNGRGVENTVFSNNIVYAWDGFSKLKGDAAQIVNVQLLGNKFQNEITPEVLIQHDQASSANPTSVVSANNVFYSIAAPDAWFEADATLSLAQWKVLVNDTTSVAQPASFPDPTRTIATYHSSIGGIPSLEAFMAEVRQQSKSKWRAEYTASAVNAYFRAGFGL
jgi:hypothetical protein